jgi:hypothetical protein
MNLNQERITRRPVLGAGWPDQRVRTCGVKPLLNTAGRLLEPHTLATKDR